MLKTLMTMALPAWLRPALLSAAAVALYLLGMMHGITSEGQKHIDYVTAQAGRSVRLAAKQIQVVHEVEVRYRDRIQTIYQQGEQIAASAPQLVTADDIVRYGVNAGFVRLYDAAWANTTAGLPAEPDREPAGVSLTDIAETEAFNATACFAWREQALGLRAYYSKLQGVTNAPDPGVE